jgi:TPR repeat protein
LPQDPAEAVKWHRRAAEQGFDPAQYAIAFRYISGRSVPQDYAVAYMWFDLAAERGNQHAARERDKIARRMTPAQIAEAQKLAREWKPTTQPVQ